MKFKNYKEYMELRDNLLAEAQKASEEGNQEEFDAKSKEITDLDAEWDAFAQRQANLNALKGAPKAPMGMVEQTNTVMTELVADSDMEYRKAFMNYVLKGTPIKMQNGTDYQTTTSDVGPVIPTTIMNRIVELMESNGNILAKVTRTAFKGGVKVPVSAAKPTAVWLAERAGGNTQKMDVSGSVVFGYYKLKVSVAVSLIVENVTLDIFEKTLSANIAEAMVRALEDAIINRIKLDEDAVTGEYTATITTNWTASTVQASQALSPDGETAAFEINTSPGMIYGVMEVASGEYVSPNDYTYSGGTLTFNTTPPEGTNAYIVFFPNEGAPYTQTLTVSGILETDRILIDAVLPEDLDDSEEIENAWAYIYKITVTDDTLLFYSREESETAIPILILAVSR